MTLDASLANLQAQADRLAGHFAAISDRIEAEGARAAVVAASALAEPPARAGHWDHVHSGYAGEPELSAPIPVRQDTPVGVVAAVDGSLLNFEGENYVPQTPQGAAPSGATPGVAAPGAVEVEGDSVAPPPAAPTAPAPWEQQDQAAAEPAPAAEEAPKKRSRRTLEEIAADNGVTLDEVKAWLGPDRKATKAAIEEYAALQESAAPQAVKDLDAQPEPAAAPAPAPMPTTVANPFGQGAQLPPAAPVVNATPQAEPVAAPAPPAPVAPVAAPDFGQGTETIADWNPFQS
jgi:hypothetical protein